MFSARAEGDRKASLHRPTEVPDRKESVHEKRHLPYGLPTHLSFDVRKKRKSKHKRTFHLEVC